MPPAPTRARAALTLLAALASFWLLADLTQAQPPQQRRLVLDVELQRQGPVQAGAERGEQTLSQRWQFSALLQGDGVPMPHNPLDPDDPRRQAEAAQRMVAAAPYLLFTGAAACGLQLSARLDERVQGRFNDVQGVVSYTETARGQESRRDDMPCQTLQAVLDTRNGRVWTALATVPQDVQGVRTREEGNRRAQRHEGRIGLRWHEAQGWLQQRLAQLSTEGQDQARLPAGSGQAEIKLKWSFRPV